MKIDVTFRGFRQLERDLGTIAEKAVPHGVRSALNDMAFTGRSLWAAEIRSKLTTRNAFTERSLRIDKARGSNVNSMQATLGTTAEYMPKREKGGRTTGPVPTPTASGESSNPRKRLVARPNKLANITTVSLGQNHRRLSRKGRNVLAVKQAAASGAKWLFLDTGRKRTLVKVLGGRRNPQLRAVWDVSQRSHATRATPTLGPALQRLEREVPSIMTRALVQQLKHHKVMGLLTQ